MRRRRCRLDAGRRILPADPTISQNPPEDAEATRTPGFAPGNRVRRIQSWLMGRADTALGRLALDWFRRYFEASKNSGCAITVYSSLSVLPAALVIASFAHSDADTNAYAQRLVTHLKLTGASAALVESTFGSASSNRLAASITVAVSALFWGIGIGQLYQDVYARAWRLKVGSMADRNANTTALTVTASTAFTLPGRCPSVPVKSTVTESPAMVMATWMCDATCCEGSGPNESTTSAKVHDPSAIANSAARIRRSP